VKGADNESIKAITNNQGEFELDNLKPGKYQVETLWPEDYSSNPSKQEVTIYDRGCTEVWFVANTTAPNKRMQRRPRSESLIVPSVPFAAPLMRDVRSLKLLPFDINQFMILLAYDTDRLQ
jgi:hypothetical protein